MHSRNSSMTNPKCCLLGESISWQVNNPVSTISGPIAKLSHYMFANILKSRNNAKPKILGLHLFWVRYIQSIALLFSDFLSCLFIFTILYTLTYSCMCASVCGSLWCVTAHVEHRAQLFRGFSLLPLSVGQRLNSVSALATSVLIHWATLLTHVSHGSGTTGNSKEGLLSSCLS